MNIGNDPKKRLNMSIKPMLNIRPGSPDGRYTLVIQLILERKYSWTRRSSLSSGWKAVTS